jgi:phosphosulfolactate synthase (CoM biosynthesis protein A)
MTIGTYDRRKCSTIDIMEMMLLIFFATLSFSFGIAYWATFDKLKKSNLLLAELFIKTRALEELNSQVSGSMNMSEDTVHKENFIKFLSDSRDWAFEYIEQSQKTIKEVSDELKVKGLDNYSKKLLALLPEIGQEKK